MTDNWTQLPDAPPPAGTRGHSKWGPGSWLVADPRPGAHRLYAFKGSYHEFYTYDTDADTWSQAKTAMPLEGTTGRCKKATDGSCAAWYSGKIYALKGNNTTEFWCYFPTGDSWQVLEDIPLVGRSGRGKAVKTGGALAGYPGTGVYAFKGNNTLEFWRYNPGQEEEEGSGEATVQCASGALGTIPRPGQSPAAGPTLDGEEPVADGLEAAKPRWNWQGTWVCYSKTDTLTGREQVYQCQYGLFLPEQRVTEIEADCEEPVYSPSGEYIAFQLDDTVSGYYQLCVTPGSDTGFGESGGADEVLREPVGCSDATGTTAAVAPVKAVAAGGLGIRSALSDKSVMSPPRIADGVTALGLVWQTTFAAEDHCYPEWSLDGEWLCYERDDDSGYTQVWRVPAFGGTEEQLTFGNSDHYLPSYLNSSEIVFTLSPNDGYDQIAKVNVLTHQVTVLSGLDTDHDRPSPAWNGSDVVAEALDDAGNTNIVKMSVLGGETWLTSGTSDIMEPDYSQDNQRVFAVRWTGITSQIVYVDAENGGYYAVTDSLAIRDNPDAYFDPNAQFAMAVYEREAWDPENLLFGHGRRRHGSGVYVAKFRKPKDEDGPQGASLGVLALDRAVPSPATDRVKIRWQVPVEADVSLRIYNTAGQLVKVLADGKTKPGAYTSVWNGTDAKGRRLANGVYFYTLDNGAKRISRKVVLTE